MPRRHHLIAPIPLLQLPSSSAPLFFSVPLSLLRPREAPSTQMSHLGPSTQLSPLSAPPGSESVSSITAAHRQEDGSRAESSTCHGDKGRLCFGNVQIYVFYCIYLDDGTRTWGLKYARLQPLHRYCPKATLTWFLSGLGHDLRAKRMVKVFCETFCFYWPCKIPFLFLFCFVL